MKWQEIEIKAKKLRDQFEAETGEKHINSQGEPDIDYVAWLEQKLVKESDSLPCAGESKTFDIHNCINDIEKVIKANTSGWMFISGSLRYQIKRAIDKMLYSR